MKLIVGLGNTGKDYAATRHNLGFLVVEQLRRSLDSDGWQGAQKKTYHAEWDTPRTVMLVKPQTMMNLSGQAVAEVMNYYKVPVEDVWVIHDEADVPFGRLRVRQGGTTTHNGVKSVAESIGGSFWRYRVGVGNARTADMPLDRFVLSKFSPDEAAELAGLVGRAAEIISHDLLAGQPNDTTYNLLK